MGFDSQVRRTSEPDKTVSGESMASVAPELPVLARDQEFEGLYRKHVKDVYHYALALLRNPADAEDVTQTTFMNAYRAYQRGAVIEKPQNWLIKIAHNVARTRYARASRRVKEVPLEDHVDQLAVPEDEKPNVEGVLRALGRLPFNQRAALVMRELEGRSYVEIADTLGVSVSAVETLIFRARRTLKVRANALRVLTVVPLPGSLAGLLEGGTFAAGGGAVTGGLVLKAAVALVAGTLATGLGGDKADRATAAKATPAALSTVSTTASATPVQRVGARTTPTRSKATRHARAGRSRAPEIATAVGRVHVDLTHPQPASTPSSAATSPTTVANEATASVTGAVAAVEQTVAAVVPTVPVQVPSLPAPPVELPPPPKLP